MNILILTPGFPSSEQDTTCIPFLQDFVLELKTQVGSENIRVISFQYPYTRGQYVWNGIKIYSAGGRNKKALNKWLTWRRVMQQANQWITANTVIHSFWLTEAAEIGARLARRHHCKHICSIMGQDVLLTNPYLQRIPLSEVLVVAPNEKAAGYFHIHTGLDTAAIIPHSIAPVINHVTDRDINLLFVASFIELKQPFIFVEAVAKLFVHMPLLRAVMIGKGPLLEEAKKMAVAQNLPIEFLGEIPRNEVIQMMHRSHLLLHTSRYEGHSTVITEALSCGCGVVCFDIGRPEVDQGIWVVDSADDLPDILNELLAKQKIEVKATLLTIAETVQQYLQLASSGY